MIAIATNNSTSVNAIRFSADFNMARIVDSSLRCMNFTVLVRERPSNGVAYWSNDRMPTGVRSSWSVTRPHGRFDSGIAEACLFRFPLLDLIGREALRFGEANHLVFRIRPVAASRLGDNRLEGRELFVVQFASRLTLGSQFGVFLQPILSSSRNRGAQRLDQPIVAGPDLGRPATTD